MIYVRQPEFIEAHQWRGTIDGWEPPWFQEALKREWGLTGAMRIEGGILIICGRKKKIEVRIGDYVVKRKRYGLAARDSEEFLRMYKVWNKQIPLDVQERERKEAQRQKENLIIAGKKRSETFKKRREYLNVSNFKLGESE